jgi:hypothetical protein
MFETGSDRHVSVQRRPGGLMENVPAIERDSGLVRNVFAIAPEPRSPCIGFPIPELGRAAPYGVYDVTRNAGWVSVGADHDTAAFAAQSIKRYWQSMG